MRYTVIIILSLVSGLAHAAVISDVTNTKHNLSTTPYNDGTDTRTVKSVTGAGGTSRICVFCHTPHAANISAIAPLWNRATESPETYTFYDSTTMEAADPTVLAAPSKLCLSCHDGTLAIGAVNVLEGQTNQTISMMNVDPDGSMVEPADGVGRTGNLGTDLRNDHPISITYNAALVAADGELFTPEGASAVRTRTSADPSPPIPLFKDPNDGDNPKVECMSCHDPHVRSSIAGEEDIKFLRLNRYQAANTQHNGSSFNEANDIICMACHDKKGYNYSAHANMLVADERYSAAGASARDFPDDGTFQVYRASCLNCHDTHTVQGAQRLLNAAVDGSFQPAQEEACYKCHSANGDTLTGQGSVSFGVPDIKTDFTSATHMPITSTDQPNLGLVEMHSIGGEGTTTTVQGSGKDMTEEQLLLGKGLLDNRHVECTDCHNPHRVIKNRLANANPLVPDAAGTHDHWNAGGHTNLASGVLRGSWGVDVSIAGYSSANFMTGKPLGWDVKKGMPGASVNVSDPWVTREYQICFKCHSEYGYDVPPDLGSSGGGTPPGTNGMTVFTDQAMEFQSPLTHKGEVTTTDSGAAFGNNRVVTNWEWSQWFYHAGTCSFGSSCYQADVKAYSPTSLSALPGYCDDNADPNCVCTECIGPTLTKNNIYGGTIITCDGVNDIDLFAQNPPGNPGHPDSPWFGTECNQTIPGSCDFIGNSGLAYSAKQCVYTEVIDYTTNNHRSWHPVTDNTGRDVVARGGIAGPIDPNIFLPPFNAGVGTQTMYCSDCHGSDTDPATAVPSGGEDGNPWGPHGSDNNFILKGDWSESTGYVQQGVSGTTQDDLCFKCHSWDDYANPANAAPRQSGFRNSGPAPGCPYVTVNTSALNLHTTHANIAFNAPGGGGFGSTFVCSNCHVAVPHGWKNKALLANLNDVGPEVGLPAGTQINRYTDPNFVLGDGYTNPPYYNKAKLWVINFKESGDWGENNCGYQGSGGPFGMIAACDISP